MCNGKRRCVPECRVVRSNLSAEFDSLVSFFLSILDTQFARERFLIMFLWILPTDCENCHGQTGGHVEETVVVNVSVFGHFFCHCGNTANSEVTCKVIPRVGLRAGRIFLRCDRRKTRCEHQRTPTHVRSVRKEKKKEAGGVKVKKTAKRRWRI